MVMIYLMNLKLKAYNLIFVDMKNPILYLEKWIKIDFTDVKKHFKIFKGKFRF